MAPVIFSEEATEPMRPLSSRNVAIVIYLEACNHFLSGCLEFIGNFVGHLALGEKREDVVGIFCMKQLQVLFFEISHFLYGNVGEEAIYAAENDSDFFFDRHRVILGLNEEAFVLTAFVDDAGGNGVDVAAEFGERFELAELSLVDFECTGYFLHCFYLSGTAYTRHVDTYVDGGADTAVEECGLKEYLTVGN